MTNRPLVWINTALAVPAGMSVYAGIRRGLRLGQDFQWSGAHLAGMHVDPYREYLAGDPQHTILLAQIPNYLHELYLLLLPIGALRFETARAIWLGLNLLLLGWIVALMRRLYRLGRAQTVLLLLLTALSTPLRIVLGNGQQSLLELLFFCLAFAGRGPVGRGLALGLSYAKYSFSPVLVLYMALRRRYRMLAISTVPVAIGLLGMWALVGGRLAVLSTEPMEVSRTGVTPGLGDAMSLVQVATAGWMSPTTVRGCMYGGALLASVACALYASRRREADRAEGAETEAAAMLAVASLLCFTHLTYDYVFLVVPLAAGLGSSAGARSRWVAAAVVVLWVGLMFSGQVPDARLPVLRVLVFCVLLGMFLLLGGRGGTEVERLVGAERG